MAKIVKKASESVARGATRRILENAFQDKLFSLEDSESVMEFSREGKLSWRAQASASLAEAESRIGSALRCDPHDSLIEQVEVKDLGGGFKIVFRYAKESID